jgi:hypothetical protein
MHYGTPVAKAAMPQPDNGSMSGKSRKVVGKRAAEVAAKVEVASIDFAIRAKQHACSCCRRIPHGVQIGPVFCEALDHDPVRAPGAATPRRCLAERHRIDQRRHLSHRRHARNRIRRCRCLRTHVLTAPHTFPWQTVAHQHLSRSLRRKLRSKRASPRRLRYFYVVAN